MRSMRSQRAEKISTIQLADDTLEVIIEMLNIIVYRTRLTNPEDGMWLWPPVHVLDFSYEGPELKFFGEGQKLKVSKLADTLYTTMKDVLVYVMSDMARESDNDYKFIIPKHTSYVGYIIKVGSVI